jgi:hypothetical protein
VAGPVLSAEEPVAGQVEMEGAGAVLIEGRVVAFGLLQGPVVLVATDRRGGGLTVRATVRRTPKGPTVARTARRIRVPRGGTVRFFVTGRRFDLRVVARRLAVSVAGHGRVVMAGDGRYLLDSGAPESWDPRKPVILGAGPPEPERRRPAPEDRPPEH